MPCRPRDARPDWPTRLRCGCAPDYAPPERRRASNTGCSPQTAPRRRDGHQYTDRYAAGQRYMRSLRLGKPTASFNCGRRRKPRRGRDRNATASHRSASRYRIPKMPMPVEADDSSRRYGTITAHAHGHPPARPRPAYCAMQDRNRAPRFRSSRRARPVSRRRNSMSPCRRNEYGHRRAAETERI